MFSRLRDTGRTWRRGLLRSEASGKHFHHGGGDRRFSRHHRRSYDKAGANVAARYDADFLAFGVWSNSETAAHRAASWGQPHSPSPEGGGADHSAPVALARRVPRGPGGGRL